MKRTLNKSVFASFLLITLTAFQAQAGTYLCMGVDEGDGFIRVEASPAADGTVKAFAHAQGYELRLLELDGSLSLTLKKSNSDIIAIVSKGSEALLFSAGAVNVNCVKSK